MCWSRRVRQMAIVLLGAVFLLGLALWGLWCRRPAKPSILPLWNQTDSLRSLGANLVLLDDDRYILFAISPDIKDEHLAVLRGRTELQYIVLHRSGVVAPGRYLADVPNLESIDLSRTSLAESDLEHIGRCPKLRTLSLSGSPIKGSGLRFLSNCKTLESLNLFDCDLAPNALASLDDLPLLNSLDLGQTRLTDSSMAHLGDLPSLKILNLSDNCIHGSGLAFLCNLRELESVNLYGNPLRADEMFAIGELTCKQIKVGGDSLGERELLQIAKVRSLVELVICMPTLTCGSLREFAATARLRVLVIACESLDDGCMEAIGTMEYLEEFKATASITDRGIAHLANLPNLKCLNLTAPITDRGLASLASVNNLKSLSLFNSRLSEKGVETLKNFRKLTSLTLVDVPVGNSLIEAVLLMPELKTLNLDHSLVDDQGVAKLIESGLSLESISLNHTRVTDRGRTMLERRFPHARVYVIGSDSDLPNPLGGPDSSSVGAAKPQEVFRGR